MANIIETYASKISKPVTYVGKSLILEFTGQELKEMVEIRDGSRAGTSIENKIELDKSFIYPVFKNGEKAFLCQK